MDAKVDKTYKSTEDLINKLQQLKGKTKLRFYRSISNYYVEMNIRIDEDTFTRNAQGFSKNYHEVLLLTKFPQTKPQVKNVNDNFYDLNYIVIKNIVEKEIVNGQHENDYINFKDIVPYHYIGRKKNNEIIR